VFGLLSIPTRSAHNASKFAVRGFSDSLRMELEIEGSPVSVTTVHPGGIKTNIVRNARLDPSVSQLTGDPSAPEEFERVFVTSPEKTARQILAAVRRDQRHALVEPDAKAVNLVARLPAGLSRRVLTAGARVRRRRAGMRAPSWR
jgi:short-subunit dehydrogenase